MPHPSIRGIGIRYLIGLTLPVTGVILVLYTVAQLFALASQERRAATSIPRPAIEGSAVPTTSPAAVSASPLVSPRK